MATVKRITDLKPYTAVLPYASEMFGVYQPLLGWKSRRIQERFQDGLESDRRQALDKLTRQFVGLVEIMRGDGGQFDIRIREGALKAGVLHKYDSVVLQQLATALPPYDQLKPSDWLDVITADRLDKILKTDVVKAYVTANEDLKRGGGVRRRMRLGPMFVDAVVARTATPSEETEDRSAAILEQQLRYESAVAGAVHMLAQNKAHAALEKIFYATHDAVEQAQTLMRVLNQDDPASGYLDLSNMNPQDVSHIQSVVLSPIAIVHLFRQYFFELDTFLGTPEKHVWLSPGSSVELVEVHTRRTIIEKTLETALEVTTSAEKTTTQQDEISDAVKEDNQQDTKFGASVTGSYASVTATSSFDYSASQKESRETTHKRMRNQTEKLSSQIKKNFKSTFKQTTDITDESSTRHVLANPTDSLINYELRRKMRQIGVQVQDIGTFLCWQCYVDDPGRELGLAKLIHIAKPPELGAIPHPEELPPLEAFADPRDVTIPFIAVNPEGADNEGEVYLDGEEVDKNELCGDTERIQYIFPQEFVCPKSNYELSSVEFDSGGQPITVWMEGGIQNLGDRAKFDLRLHSADFKGQNSVTCKVILHWSPTGAANDALKAKNAENLASFKEQERKEYEKSYMESVKERVTMASKIATRAAEELREEERIVVYRRLIQEMLMNNVPLPDDRSRHVVAEVINSMFDVDKMLYFVAPEWWRPRLHRSRQQLPERPQEPSNGLTFVRDENIRRGLQKFAGGALGGAPSNPLASSTVGWGGVDDPNRDSYYITDESDPARFGSSLGWLLQLDGDNMRNAFLNAPWVKAVIPIRPGQELAAINWLKGVEGMNGITDDVIYHASNPDERGVDGTTLMDGKPMMEVLKNLARRIQKKYEDGLKPDILDPALVDNENTVTATPIDRVYEHGFFPLKDGFRANVGDDYEVFDQWTEVLPTDQIVPVEVKYDPKTGRQL
jgi:hypothetical protein